MCPARDTFKVIIVYHKKRIIVGLSYIWHRFGSICMSVKLQHSFDIYTWSVEPRFRWRPLVWFVFLFVELLLVASFLLQLFASNSIGLLETITSSIINATEYLLLPLTVVFGVSSTSNSAFDGMTLLAILLYWLVAVVILNSLKRSSNTSRIESARAYSKRKYGY